jgi:serine/threonine protein kinase
MRGLKMKFKVVEQKYRELLENIVEYFKNSEDSIHKARNEVKVIVYDNTTLVIKSFKIPHIINRVAYTFFRDSKAKRSYENSLKIIEFVPKPIGYIEFHKNFLLNQSYFVSENFKYDFTIREPLLDAKFEDRVNIFKKFANFTYKLHEKGILHLDYSPGNILIKKENDRYIFKLVDINRMRFIDLDVKERLKNFSKLWAEDSDLDIIIDEYIKLSNLDIKKPKMIAQRYSHIHKKRVNAKNRRKGR